MYNQWRYSMELEEIIYSELIRHEHMITETDGVIRTALKMETELLQRIIEQAGLTEDYMKWRKQ